MNCNFRIGQGIDIHQLVPCQKEDSEDNFLILGGVKIQSEYKIVAHSDGDLALHAIVDSILGALGLPNIGHYFPASDVKWKNKDSKFFLLYAIDMMEKRHYKVNNLDITIVSEVPKISKHREAIINNIASIFNIEKDRINIKGTTSEKKGFIGRKEGIQCYAIILLESNKESS